MIIALSVVTGWILLSFLLALFSGAMLRRGMEAPQNVDRFHVSKNDDPELVRAEDAHFSWSSDKPSDVVNNPGQMLEGMSAQKGSARVHQSSLAEVSVKSSSWCLPWAHRYFPSDRTTMFVEDNLTATKWVTFGTFCPGKVFFPRASFVFQDRVDN
jgi:hypothetical protein